MSTVEHTNNRQVAVLSLRLPSRAGRWLAIVGLRWIGPLVVFLAVSAIVGGVARASEFDDFQDARSAYEVGRYEQAEGLFEALVGTDTPRLQNRTLVLESLKYLAASQLFLGKQESAEATFTRLLRMEIDYVLDPLGFPHEVQVVFSRAKRKLEQTLEEERLRQQEAAEAAVRDQALKRERQLERHRKLVELASVERVETRRSRLVGLIPFGVGQFQNGHDGLGLVLAVTETTLFGAAMTTFFLHQRLQDLQPEQDKLADARNAERAFRYTNQVSVALFALVAITGIIDAQLRFRGAKVTERRRKLPPELSEPIDVSLLPTGIRVTF